MVRTIEVLPADTDELKEKAFEIRREVFVVEQQVTPAEEFDAFEATSKHFVALNADGRPVGAARWRNTDDGIKLERFAVKKTLRGGGLGARLVQAVLDDIRKHSGSGHRLYLHAQIKAVSLYARFGFQKIGEQFEECDILHYKMEKIN